MTPDELLRAYHARFPGATPLAFAGGRLPDGRSSYQVLADLPAADDRVLDLGCGDGHLLELLIARGVGPLVGIDMSAEELAAAARRTLPGVELIEARAQALPLATGSIDWALSHLAFMLMSDVDQVVAELARVLRPGGRFAAIVGGGPGDEEDGFALFLRLFQEAYDELPAKPPRLGDRRTREAGGFASLFRPGTGFAADIEESALSVRLDADGARVWDILAAMYEMMFVGPDRAAALRARFLAEAGAGTVRCAMRCRLLVATRAAAT